MIVTRKALSRRTFLRGAGAALALPLLDAMVPALTAQARTPAAPQRLRRLGYVYMPMGCDHTRWVLPGDTLVVWKLDRLGRSLENLIELSKTLQERGVDLVVLDQGIDTSTAIGRMFFQLLGSIAEFEHALMYERTRDGLAAARARGRTGGQKPKLGPRQVKLAREMYDEKGPDGKRAHTVEHIAQEFGVTRPTIYRHLAKP